MAYSNKKISNDPTMFPAIQTWMAWVADLDWRKSTSYTDSNGNEARRYHPESEGKLRYYYSQADARKSLMWTGSKSKYRGDQTGEFITDWAVYEWVEGEWVKRFEGFAGEVRGENPLFKRVPTKEERKHPIQQSKEQKAIESILKAAG